MIPVQMAPEPSDFDERVRQPGRKFLKTTPAPNKKQWESKALWRLVLSDMRIAYRSICAYCATKIRHSTSFATVDHFIPKTKQQEFAYEWSNFRYASIRFNQRKGTGEILDPFQIEYGWFILDFTSFVIKPAPELSQNLKEEVRQTIIKLKLNSDRDLINERYEFYFQYLNSKRDYEYLESEAPFIAYELKRQGLVPDANRQKE